MVRLYILSIEATSDRLHLLITVTITNKKTNGIGSNFCYFITLHSSEVAGLSQGWPVCCQRRETESQTSKHIHQIRTFLPFHIWPHLHIVWELSSDGVENSSPSDEILPHVASKQIGHCLGGRSPHVCIGIQPAVCHLAQLGPTGLSSVVNLRW